MAHIDIEVLLRDLNYQLKSALAEALHENVEGHVSVDKVYQTFVAATVRRCPKPQRVSEEVVVTLKR